ncbi:tetratricopeptide repeat protein [Leeuwenhoekiella sp. MAR_2009_132]|uniref:tetratricopeptide repeat protein n=1 Tax=Leeuwenhoekiella sp. MAR_2009_132 TaxID=1392489 RepID=UPI00048FE166|nr:tetratricopeptide repeat protein [Leeuwenhoekiella sp. MAR_2009_132]
MSMDMDQPEKTKFYFEQGIKYYPNSANTYDSLADYYERTGDKASALQAVTKAYELNPDPYYKERMESLKGN